MAIGLSAKQKKELAAMLPNVEESVASLKRLIADAKDRTKALARLDEAEQAQRKHATEVGIPFNAEAFGRRRAELNALPKMLTVEEGQLASFTALQRAIGVVVEGPYTREGRGAGGAKPRKPATGSARKASGARKGSSKSAGKSAKSAKASKSPARSSQRPNKPPATRVSQAKVARPKSAPAKAPMAAEQAPAPRMPVVKPLPLALGS